MKSKLNFEVIWSPEDHEYVARCALFPSLSWLDQDPVEALKGLIKVIDEDDVLSEMK